MSLHDLALRVSCATWYSFLIYSCKSDTDIVLIPFKEELTETQHINGLMDPGQGTAVPGIVSLEACLTTC